ncbi:MAG: glycogen debranching protein GlgX [Planctomycetaceae bacterium]|nr:glycogen debranching protein GlgX [Planctomycetaceae bacterium]
MLMRRQPHLEHMQFTHTVPYGAILSEDGVQFLVFSRNATAMKLLLYKDVGDMDPHRVITFRPEVDRWGDIWGLFVPGLRAGQLYHFQADGPFEPEHGHRFDPKARLIDPYAKALAGTFLDNSDGITRPPKCVVVDDHFDWSGDRHLRRSLSETVIYEMHVRGFTQHASSGVKHPGTYLGVIDKIPYLKKLGVTAVELMPINEFPILGSDGKPARIKNYWGYDSMAFFSPHRGYAYDKSPGGQVREFKEMVKALHSEGIEVILDVVFNHTCEGNEHGPTLSFKGLENSVYYMLERDKRYYKNYSGCGNTVNGNHPITREMIFHCLRYWVHNYHIDGFRFDLASILSRDRNGNLVPNPPLVEQIAEDPLLSDAKMIAEAWDAAGAYQVGSFGNSRWAEWNGRFRDDVRRVWRGDSGMLGALATRLSGSSDLYQSGGRPPYCSINFVTSHDGFTMNDLVSYNHKHNLANGEDNRDGDNNNHSFNYGIEGPTDRKPIDGLRLRQIKNMMTTLLLSQGVPMLVAGDEFRRTQQGNNNAYCQDNEISWLDWKLTETNAELLRFMQALIAFRISQPTLRRESYLTGKSVAPDQLPDVSWYGPLGTAVDWHQSQQMTCLLTKPLKKLDPQGLGRDVMILFNTGEIASEFQVPVVAKERKWRLFLDTAEDSPKDIFPAFDGPFLNKRQRIVLPSKTTMVYVAEMT